MLITRSSYSHRLLQINEIHCVMTIQMRALRMKHNHTNDGSSDGFADAAETGPTYEAVGQFMRTKAVGLVTVVNLTPDTDLHALYPYAPAEVSDLQYIAMSYVDKTVTLQWTAVGDYADQETGENGEYTKFCKRTTHTLVHGRISASTQTPSVFQNRKSNVS